MPITKPEIDDTLMEADANVQSWLKEVEGDYNAPVKATKAAMTWTQFLQQLMPGLPANMIERELMKRDPKAYQSAKDRFMEAMNGSKS